MKADLKSEVKADVSLSPRRSQVHGFIYNCFAGCFALVGLYFAWHNNPNLWIPFAVAVAFAAMGFASLLVTHRNTDMAGAKDTRFNINEDGISYSSDPRAPHQKEVMLELSRAINKLATIKELPLADGLVDKDFNVLPDTKSEAEQASTKANGVMRELLEATVAVITPSLDSDAHGIEAPKTLDIPPTVSKNHKG